MFGLVSYNDILIQKKHQVQELDLSTIFEVPDLNWEEEKTFWDVGVSNNYGYPKMDGENNGKPY